MAEVKKMIFDDIIATGKAANRFDTPLELTKPLTRLTKPLTRHLS